MKHITTILVLILLLVGFSIFFDRYLHTKTEQLITMTEACETPEDVEALTDKFDQISSVAELVVDHSEIDSLTKYLWSMKVEVVSNPEDFLVSRKETIELLKHIAQRNTFDFNNVF